MRISNASRISVFLSLVVALTVGCGGSAEQEKLTKDSEPPIPGMVWNDASESWEMPNQGGGGGEEDPYGIDSYNNQASNDGGSSDEVDPYATNGSSGYDSDPYATNSSNDSDPYAVKPSDDDGSGSDPDPYAVSSSNTSNDDSDGGYGDDAYASASSDGGYDAPAGGSGGSGVFAETIEPILRKHCYNCHGGGPRGKKGDLELHTVEAISSAKIIKPFDAEDSELFYRVSRPPGDDVRMPPKGPGLSAADLAALESWIKSGASYGGGGGNDGGYGDAYATGAGASSRDDGGYSDSDYADDSDSDGETEGRRAPPPPKNLAGAASLAFQRGDDTEAMNHLYAQSLVNSDAGKEVLSKYKWVKALRRSKLAVRWGVGVKYTPKGGYGGSPRPAGVEQDLPNSDSDRGGSDGDDEFAAASFENRTLSYYTGDIGDELIIRLQNRIERGWYGDILKQELDGALSQGNGDDEFDDYDDDDGGYGRGGGGGGGYGGYGGGGGGGRDGGSSRDKPDGDLIEQIMPGVVMVGEASQAVLLERAKKQGVDMLVVFDVSSEGNRKARIVNTSTRVRLYDVVTEKMLKATGSIKNVELQRAREEDPDDETIQLEMDKIFSNFVDKAGYTVEDFPAARNEKVKKAVIGFVKNLIDQPSENPLWKLSEVRFYQSLGLLTDAHVAAANKRIAPDEAPKLSNVVDDNAIRTLFASHLVADAEDSGGDEGPRRRKDGFR